MITDDIEIKTYDTFSLTPKELKTIRLLLSKVFSTPYDKWKEAYSKKYISMCTIILNKGEIIAHGSIVRREVEHKNNKYNVGGIGNIFVIPAYRHLGIGTKVMSTINDMLVKNKFDLGVLFCHPKLHNYYAQGDWIKKKAGKVYFNKNGQRKSEETTYLYPVSISKANLANWMNDDIFIGNNTW